MSFHIYGKCPMTWEVNWYKDEVMFKDIDLKEKFKQLIIII